jgi:hypothetical protein
MRFLAALCFALAFLMAVFGWRIEDAGAIAMIALGLVFLALSSVWDFVTYRRAGPPV